MAARFWAKIFGLNFAVGVVTGIPMEFQFGTNWADFSRYAGGVVGQTLAREGMFASLKTDGKDILAVTMVLNAEGDVDAPSPNL